MLFKLTNKEGMTQGNTKWGEGIRHSVPVSQRKAELCTPRVLHCYRDANLALLLNPIHANIPADEVRVWEAEGEVCVEDWGKAACFDLTIVREVELPRWFADERLRGRIQILFAVLCAESVLSVFESKFPEDKRPREAIEAAKRVLNRKMGWRGARDAAADAADAAAAAADAAYDAAYAAAYAADAAYAAAYARDAAAYAAAYAAADAPAYAADAAAAYAAYAADAAASAAPFLNFASLALEAIRTMEGEREKEK